MGMNPMTKKDQMNSINQILQSHFRIACLLLLIVVFMLVSACGSISGKKPEEINMGAMGAHSHEGHGDEATTAANTVSCADMTEPPSNGPVQTFQLKAAKTSLTLNNGKKTEAWTYNGSTPGPELRVQEGDRVVVHLSNENIDKGVTIHWHGVILPCSQDGVAGVTQDAVWPGEQFTYEFVAAHPGTYWYHSHQHSSEQARKGLMGRLIVEPKEDSFHYDRDYAVTLQMLNDKHLLTNGSAGGLTLDAKPGETVRLRIINSYSLVQWMGVAGTDFRVISMDGQDLNGPGLLHNEWIPIGGGQRYDLLFTMPDSSQVNVYSKEEEEWSISIGEGAEPKLLKKDALAFDFTTYGTPKDDGISPDMNFDQTYNLVLGPLSINGKSGHQIPPILVKEGEWIKVRLEHEARSIRCICMAIYLRF
jgi:FtsP/CotA-like multicopper oxidase with cupredoxin domain